MNLLDSWDNIIISWFQEYDMNVAFLLVQPEVKTIHMKGEYPGLRGHGADGTRVMQLNN